MTRISPARQRPGLTLLEVLVALSVFLFSLIGIGQLVTMSADRARDVQQQGQAIQLCQAKLAEVKMGAVPLTAQSEVPLDEDPTWQWSLDANPGNYANLFNVTIRVSRIRPDGTRMGASLSQMVLDPALRGSAPSPTAQQPSSSQNQNGSPSSGSPGDPTGGAAGLGSVGGNSSTKAPASGSPSGTAKPTVGSSPSPKPSGSVAPPSSSKPPSSGPSAPPAGPSPPAGRGAPSGPPRGGK